MAALVAWIPRSTAGTSENAPRNFPIGVRAPSTMTARSMATILRPDGDRAALHAAGPPVRRRRTGDAGGVPRLLPRHRRAQGGRPVAGGRHPPAGAVRFDAPGDRQASRVRGVELVP